VKVNTFNFNEVDYFIQVEALPLVLDFKLPLIKLLQSHVTKYTIVLITNIKEKYHDPMLTVFQSVAQRLRGFALAVHISDTEKTMIEYYGLGIYILFFTHCFKPFYKTY
jgi:hypothetical protein